MGKSNFNPHYRGGKEIKGKKKKKKILILILIGVIDGK
jgi:hypothetical protein